MFKIINLPQRKRVTAVNRLMDNAGSWPSITGMGTPSRLKCREHPAPAELRVSSGTVACSSCTAVCGLTRLRLSWCVERAHLSPFLDVFLDTPKSKRISRGQRQVARLQRRPLEELAPCGRKYGPFLCRGELRAWSTHSIIEMRSACLYLLRCHAASCCNLQQD